MRKLIFISFAALSLLLAAPRVQAQESAPDQVAKQDEAPDLMTWKLINTGIFVVLLGYGVLKFAPKFFQARSLDIQKAIKDATGLKIDADFRYSEIDKKMANLPDATARLKAEAAAEMEREHQRMIQEAGEEMAHIGKNADFEIESLRKEGILQVKQHTAQLALALAERRLQAHYAQEGGPENIREFVSLVGSKN